MTDPDDEQGWDRDRDGRMRDCAVAPEDEIATEPYTEEDDD